VASGIVGTSWTSPSLSTGTYWFEVASYVGSNWAGANSSASSQRVIAVAACA
jgi:hypothetical protein